MIVMGSILEMTLLDFGVEVCPLAAIRQGCSLKSSTWRDERAVVSRGVASSETASGKLGS